MTTRSRHPSHSSHSERLPATARASRISVLASALTSVLLLAGLSGLHPVAQAAGAPKVTTKTAVSADAPVVKVDNPWIRPTVKGQTATGGFMGLTASRDLTLVGFTAPVAGEAELHEMAMEGDVMRMRGIDALALPAGQAVALKPGAGGKHLMLMGLKRQLKAGETVRITLKLRDADGKVFTQDVTVPVRAGTASGAAPTAHDHDGHDHHQH